jgi:hypothetical protein
VLLFHVEAGDEDDARSLYSIPKKRALQATGFGRRFVADVNWVTPQGWVLTLDPASRAVSLRDPFSSRTVRLPPDRECLLDSQATRCLLSTHRPTDPACVVLVVHRKLPVLYYCRPGGGEDRWFQHGYQSEIIHEDRDISVGVMARLTAVGPGSRFLGHELVDDKVVTLDFSPPAPGPTLTVADAADSPWPVGCSQVRSWKVESCGEVFAVRLCYTALCDKRVSRVQVDRLDWSTNAWVREAAAAGLGANRAFFVSTGQFGVSMAAHEAGLEPNCIYFTEEGDKGLYVYDTQQGTTKLHNLDPNVPDSAWPILLMPALA